MATETRTIHTSKQINLQKLGSQIADWMIESHQFSLKDKQWEGDAFIVNLRKTGFFRQLSGLVFTYKIELTKGNDCIFVSVDDGDIRNQLGALGVAWFIAWPMLVTAGWGMYAKGDFRKTILNRIEGFL